ncbi:hypothetical protein SETIT_1G354600v2 [Setaria italica]|uniref:Serine protease n=1 Tax=Setaria italica TaxID=4555 RepID=A0A368PSM1_SETIT|nr:uncharacterized protein LOC105914636 [Setaria italica]RCV08786.1 hypothetical protein SETIT_1G354600v2 [Setaria italica]
MQQVQDQDPMKTNPSPNVYRRATDYRMGVVLVITERNRLGTGFVIQEATQLSPPAPALVLTCYHTVQASIDKGVGVYVRKPLAEGGVQELLAKVVKYDAVTDMALLTVPQLRGTPVLTFTPPGDAGDCAIAVGYCNPVGLFKRNARVRLPGLSPGSIRWIVPHGDAGAVTHTKLYLTFVAMHGMSGAPVVSGGGVIGMLTHVTTDGTRLSIAVSSGTVIQILRGWAELPVNGPSTAQEVLNSLRIRLALDDAQA